MVITQSDFFKTYGKGRHALEGVPSVATPDIDVRVLTALVDHFRPRRCLEMGCNTGATSAAILAGNSDIEEYVGIDLQKERYPDGKGGRFALHDPRFELIQMPRGTRDIQPDTFPKPFDFIFVDAAHDYNNVRLDTELARALLATSGVLTWHDYNYRTSPDVKRYIHEINTDRLKPIAWVQNTWICYQINRITE